MIARSGRIACSGRSKRENEVMAPMDEPQAGPALAALEQAVPALLAHRRPEPADLHWEEFRTALGVPAPGDFQLLAQWYPTFTVNDFLHVTLPIAGNEAQVAHGMLGDTEMIRDLWENDDSHGNAPFPEPNGLLPCASTNHGDLFSWVVNGDDPDRWPVMIATRNDYWWTYDGGLVAFLSAYLGGSLERHGLPPIPPLHNPPVRAWHPAPNPQ
ncbi:SMI1/KNR4 family protein [Streptodolium elevatio]|uniref:SMI1/KNR4 family protein n=1 Tax=Streptodolium elevatio TaxID=3157996 RepID=A0ABV3DVL8_9ACTN